MKSKFIAFDGKEFSEEYECIQYEMDHYKELYDDCKEKLLKISKKVELDLDNEFIEEFDLSCDAVGYRIKPSSKIEVDIVKNFISSYDKYYELFCEFEEDHSFNIESNLKDPRKIKINDIYLIILDDIKDEDIVCVSARECIYGETCSYTHTLHVISYEVAKEAYLKEFERNTKDIFFD